MANLVVIVRFGWICPLMAIQEDDILRTAGLDAVIHIRMYYLAFRIFGLFAIYGRWVGRDEGRKGGSLGARRRVDGWCWRWPCVCGQASW